MQRILTFTVLPGVLVLMFLASSWGAEDATSLRFQTGMAAIDVALAAEDGEVRDGKLGEAIEPSG